jgi:phage baseplate assembly protein W
MAVNIQQINPIDLQPSIGVGVGLPFSNSSVFNTTYTTREALKANLINFFLTGENERFLNPNIGVGIQATLFDQITSDIEDRVEQIIRTGVNIWFPTVTLNTLDVLTSPDSNTLTVTMKYSVRNTNIQDELVINFEQ